MWIFTKKKVSTISPLLEDNCGHWVGYCRHFTADSAFHEKKFLTKSINSLIYLFSDDNKSFEEKVVQRIFYSWKLCAISILQKVSTITLLDLMSQKFNRKNDIFLKRKEAVEGNEAIDSSGSN